MSNYYNGRNKTSVNKTGGNSNNINSVSTATKNLCSKKDKALNIDYTDSIATQPQNSLKNKRIQGQQITRQTLAKFMSDVIPHAHPNSYPQNEQVNWAKIQSCPGALSEGTSNFVIIVGLARGYQIFLLMENGDFEEIISVRKAPLKIGHLLTITTEQQTDRFSDKRPLIALYSLDNGAKTHTVNFLSLRTGKFVHNITFPKALMEIDSSPTCLLILMEESIMIYEHENFAYKSSIKLPRFVNSSPPFSLSGNLLAFADHKLNDVIQSIGGFVKTTIDQQSPNSQMLNTAKNITKAVSSISESIVSTLSNHSHPQHKHHDHQPTSNSAGIVSVVNVDKRIKANDKDTAFLDYVAHFCAHQDSPIGYLLFGRGGQLILTGTLAATLFNVFLLHLHPNSSSLSSVQHIYSLSRGQTAARVIDGAFSFDNRWLTISTNHGTAHVFAINSYGGLATSRTHCGKMMNRGSKFEKTAGIKDGIIRPQLLVAKNTRLQPALRNSVLAKTVANLGGFCANAPVASNAMTMLKQRIFSTENLCAWASDNTPSILQPSKSQRQVKFGRILSARFIARVLAKPQSSESFTSMLVMNNEGILTEYVVCAQPRVDDSIASLNPVVDNSQNTEVPAINKVTLNRELFHVKLKATLQWELTRSCNTTDFELVDPPLSTTSPLIQSQREQNLLPVESKKKARGSWLPFLEVLTHTGPHRRLWLGPQFSFSVYTSAEHSPFDMMPSSSVQINGMQKCCPVLIEKKTAFIDATSRSSESVAKIICGSWSSEFDFKALNEEISMVKEKICSAMNEEDALSQQQKERHLGLEDEDDVDIYGGIFAFNSEECEDNNVDVAEDDACCLMHLSGIDDL